MGAEAKDLDQIRQIDGGLAGRQCKPDVVLDRAPGQKARLLKYNPETSRSRFPEPTAPDRDPRPSAGAATQWLRRGLPCVPLKQT